MALRRDRVLVARTSGLQGRLAMGIGISGERTVLGEYWQLLGEEGLVTFTAGGDLTRAVWSRGMEVIGRAQKARPAIKHIGAPSSGLPHH